MKKILIVFVMFVWSSLLVLQADSSTGNVGYSEIEIKKETGTDRPRGLIVIPLECYWYNGVLYFEFNDFYENVNILIINQETDEIEVDVLLPYLQNYDTILSNGNIYDIKVVLENGDLYYGILKLN